GGGGGAGGSEDSGKKALDTALRFLSYRDRSVKEVEERLRHRGFAPGETASSIEFLLEAGYLDDERFARNLAATRTRVKNWGPARIASELYTRGVSREITEEVLSAIDEPSQTDTAERELKSWSRKNGVSLSGTSRKNLEKAFRHLRARGFSTQVIINLINGCRGG
ncbi:MAG TPA: regulatory protein RecX, partial [Thermodesulfobacteriota bacterium]|nr:regulatory protein RecX [Thermodesulfobacteriota bacterium]